MIKIFALLLRLFGFAKGIEFESQSATRLNETGLELIELAGRICYGSKKGIAQQFVRARVKQGHLSILRHVFLTVRFEGWAKDKIKDEYEKLPYFTVKTYASSLFVGANLQAWYELYQRAPNLTPQCVWLKLANIDTSIKSLDGTLVELKGEGKFPLYHNIDIVEPKDLPQSIKRHFLFYVYHIVTDRGITHEIVRHQTLNFTQSSTRYIDCTKVMRFIVPFFNTLQSFLAWKGAVIIAFNAYKLLMKHVKPEFARSVMPNSLVSEIIVSGNLPAWEHFFEMRCVKTAHPQIQEIALKIWMDLGGVGCEDFDTIKGSDEFYENNIKASGGSDWVKYYVRVWGKL